MFSLHVSRREESCFSLRSWMTVLKGSLIPSRITEAQSCYPLSCLLPYASFSPEGVTMPSVRWVKFYNSPLEMAQGVTENNPHVSLEFLIVNLYGHAVSSILSFSFGGFPLEYWVCLVNCIFQDTLCSGNIPVWPPDLHTSIGVRVRSV